jgi:transposase-like protein
MRFSQSYKEAMVKKALSPGGPSQVSLAKKIGVHPVTFSRWVTETSIVDDMSKKKIKKPVSPPDNRTAEEKMQIVLKAAQIGDDKLGAFLRESGVHEAQLNDWRKEMLEGLGQEVTVSIKGRRDPDAKKIRELEKKLKNVERELNRKDKALAEAAALIMLKKRMDAYWGVEDDDTE